MPDVTGLGEGVAVADRKGNVDLLAQGSTKSASELVTPHLTHSKIYVFPTPVGPIRSMLLLSILTGSGRNESSG